MCSYMSCMYIWLCTNMCIKRNGNRPYELVIRFKCWCNRWFLYFYSFYFFIFLSPKTFNKHGYFQLKQTDTHGTHMFLSLGLHLHRLITSTDFAGVDNCAYMRGWHGMLERALVKKKRKSISLKLRDDPSPGFITGVVTLDKSFITSDLPNTIYKMNMLL